ncbi:carbamoyl phosphate synthase small subunit [Oceanobacillus sp. Castelsardo]|uniref:carbamoyl phosphate synthase small subunit n=1 Tax=Oceanobacillus sp. Castelsardo TaxID=1851204 RepID=UPI00083960D2|nr:carbamoyl phosphate synthase small subunit [Oceanobacillus sp. Castelsardo]
MTKGYLVLETGETFVGEWLGADIETEGEVIFNTSMTGYQEMLTDPSYRGQILTFTYPTIGSYGINEHDDQSNDIAVSAVIMNDVCDEPSHYQSTTTISEQLKKSNIPGLANIDTRSLVDMIKKYKTVKGTITKQEGYSNSKWKSTDSIELVSEVSVKVPEVYGNGDHHVVILDFGYKKSLLQALLKENCKVTIVPYNTSFEHIKSLLPDGILISNGPGNPEELHGVLSTIKELTQNYPTLGISLGHQLIALAYGAKTEKLSFGHRGNYPVKHMGSGKVYITSQNHGYAVMGNSIDSNEFQVLFRNVNDKSVEGMKHIHLPVQSVQFHPEAHPGPSDTEYIFADFVQQMISSGGKKYVEA